MITFAEPQDKEQIYQIWKALFADDDNGYTDYYFQSRYEQAITYVIKEEGLVKAVLQRQKHKICFHGTNVLTSLILGVATLPQYQRQGLMRKLMTYALADAKKEETLTMIQAYHPKIYMPFGFQVYYHTRTIPFQSNGNKVIGHLGAPDFSLCLKLYQQAMISYEGTIVRNTQSFLNMQAELQAQDGRLLGYYENHEMKAYGALEVQPTPLITECHGDPMACQNLLTLVEQEYGKLSLQICDHDGDPYTMLLFHDWAHFCQLTNLHEPTPHAYFQNLQTLLYMHENT